MKDLWIIGSGEGTLAETIYKETSRIDYGATLHTGVGEVDITNPYEIREHLNYLSGWQPGLDQLDIVYCAGFNRLAPLGKVQNFDLNHTFDVNVKGFIWLLDAIAATAVIPKANIVAIVSDAARTAMRTSIAYCASKAALAHAVKCGARELAPQHRVNGVSPSVIAATPMTQYVDEQVQKLRGWTHREALDYESSLVPMKTRVTKDQVAQVVKSTLDGPWFQTGAIIDITGGK